MPYIIFTIFGMLSAFTALIVQAFTLFVYQFVTQSNVTTHYLVQEEIAFPILAIVIASIIEEVLRITLIFHGFRLTKGIRRPLLYGLLFGLGFVLVEVGLFFSRGINDISIHPTLFTSALLHLFLSSFTAIFLARGYSIGRLLDIFIFTTLIHSSYNIALSILYQ